MSEDISTIPRRVADAATLLGDYATENGWKDWEFFGVASRDLVSNLRAKIKSLEKELVDEDTKYAKDLDRLGAALVENKTLSAQLHVVLDAIDYTANNCQVNDMVGAVIDFDTLKRARSALVPRNNF